MYWISFILVLVLGGVTILLHDDRFLKWKPTLVNAAFAIAFWVSPLFGSRKPLIRHMMGAQIRMSDRAWSAMNHAWAAFFVFSAVLNIVVAYTCSQAVWVNFKVFGLLGLTLVFMVGVMMAFGKHITPVEQPGEKAAARLKCSAVEAAAAVKFGGPAGVPLCFHDLNRATYDIHASKRAWLGDAAGYGPNGANGESPGCNPGGVTPRGSAPQRGARKGSHDEHAANKRRLRPPLQGGAMHDQPPGVALRFTPGFHRSPRCGVDCGSAPGGLKDQWIEALG
jgi:intracellular septation protein